MNKNGSSKSGPAAVFDAAFLRAWMQIRGDDAGPDLIALILNPLDSGNQRQVYGGIGHVDQFNWPHDVERVLSEHEDVYVRALCASARRLAVAGREEIVHFPKNGGYWHAPDNVPSMFREAALLMDLARQRIDHLRMADDARKALGKAQRGKAARS
jgi:hypothetical protein